MPLSKPPTLTAFEQTAAVIRYFRSAATKNRHHKHSRTCTVMRPIYIPAYFPMEHFGLLPIPRLKATMYFVREKPIGVPGTSLAIFPGLWPARSVSVQAASHVVGIGKLAPAHKRKGRHNVLSRTDLKWALFRYRPNPPRLSNGFLSCLLPNPYSKAGCKKLGQNKAKQLLLFS